jgi:hypothetical protein
MADRSVQVARPRTMDSERLLVSIFNARRDITAAIVRSCSKGSHFIETTNVHWPLSGQQSRVYRLLLEEQAIEITCHDGRNRRTVAHRRYRVSSTLGRKQRALHGSTC